MDDDPAPAAPAASRAGFLKVLGGLAAAGIVASAVLAIVTQIPDPPLEPTYTFARCQALWGDGRYGVKYTFLVTWLSTMAAMFAPVALVFALVGIFRPRPREPFAPGWPRFEWKHMSERTRAALGCALTLAALLFGGPCLFAPETFVSLGFIATILLMLFPFALMLGTGLLLDVAQPPIVIEAPIAELLCVAPASPGHPHAYFLVVPGHQIPLSEAVWRQLQTGDTVALRLSGVFHRLLDLARHPDP